MAATNKYFCQWLIRIELLSLFKMSGVKRQFLFYSSIPVCEILSRRSQHQDAELKQLNAIQPSFFLLFMQWHVKCLSWKGLSLVCLINGPKPWRYLVYRRVKLTKLTQLGKLFLIDGLNPLMVFKSDLCNLVEKLTVINEILSSHHLHTQVHVLLLEPFTWLQEISSMFIGNSFQRVFWTEW